MTNGKGRGGSKFVRGLFVNGHVLFFFLFFFHHDLQSFTSFFPFRVLDGVGREEDGSACCALYVEVH